MTYVYGEIKMVSDKVIVQFHPKVYYALIATGLVTITFGSMLVILSNKIERFITRYTERFFHRSNEKTEQ